MGAGPRVVLGLLAAMWASPSPAQDGGGCPTAETAGKGFTVTLDNGVKLIVGPTSSDIVAYEEHQPRPGGGVFVNRLVSHAGIVTLSSDNDVQRTVFTFDKPIEALVPKATGESVEFTFQSHIEPKQGEKRTRDGVQTHSVVGTEQIIVGRCAYTAHVFLKSGRFPADEESYEQRILYVPELRIPLNWRIERTVKGKTDKFQMRAAGIEAAS